MNTRVTDYLVGTVSRLLLVSAGPGDGVSDPEPDSTVCSGGLAVAGVEARTRCEVTAVARTEAGDWAAATSQGTVRAACVINCAGNFGDNVEKMWRDVNMNIIASSDT